MRVNRTRLFMGIFTLIVGGAMQSCVGYKDLVTFNATDDGPETLISDSTIQVTPTPGFQEYQIKPYDQLMIKINAFDGSTEEFLNREFGVATGTPNVRSLPEDIYFRSIAVSDSGTIVLPLLGEIKVEGMTTLQLKAKLDESYKPYLRFVSTNVKLANMRVTVLGEVSSPGVFYLYQDRNTILDAIGLAGDFTEFGNRKKVRMIRQTELGAKTVFLNLSRPEFATTEFFYVQPHDLIYVEPLKAKSFDVSSESVGLVFSAISVTALLINIFIKK
ncbi:MAG: polysaccharide biosynthesis/export family protein [Phaeodactylibacter sp.]|nr:polysaccharide biosynthesis/export family protein [Phaeodactylibacter sp.]MCB9048960.1 polysaccharide biosynthesis/export family protein [Lewinellaceae bacterium]